MNNKMNKVFFKLGKVLHLMEVCLDKVEKQETITFSEIDALKCLMKDLNKIIFVALEDENLE